MASNNRNRPSQYDWFKGPSGNNGKKNRKNQAKTVWRFAKIFLIFSIFFITMWGCVQTFVNTSNTDVGNGVEMYTSQDKIAPRILSVNVTKDKSGDIISIQPIKIDDKITSDDENIIYESPYINPKTNKTEVNNIKTEFKNQGVENLGESTAGGNFVASVSYNGKIDASKNGKFGIKFNNQYIVLSTKSKENSFFSEGLINFNWLKDKIYFYEPNNNATPINKVLDINKYNELKGQSKNIFDFNAKVIKSIFLTQLKQSNPSVTATWTADQKSKHLILMTSILNVLGVDKNGSFQNKYLGKEIGDDYAPIYNLSGAWSYGPFYGMFVYPIAWLTETLVDAMPFMQGWESIIVLLIIVVIISLFIFALSFKGILQQTKTQELNAKKAVIEAKYERYKGNKQMDNRKRQEIADLYKKEGVSVVAPLITALIAMPFTLVMFRLSLYLQYFKGTKWLGISFAATSWRKLFAGYFQYLPLMIFSAGLSIFSQLYTKILTRKRDKNRINVHQKAALKRSDRTQNIMMFVFAFFALIFSAAYQIYSIFRSLWKIMEVQITHHILVKQRKNKISKLKA